jgi:cyclohexyl-isocyanide hydratase
MLDDRRFSMTADSTLSIGMLLFEGVTQLDLTGPYEILARMPETHVTLIASTMAPVRSEWGLSILPDATFESAPSLDVVCVPGGWGVDACLTNEDLLDFLRVRSERARFTASVCSGALLLGAAGLLRGYRATTHWMSHDLLPLLGAIAVPERVVRDRDRITSAGVTAGIDMSLTLAAEIFGASVAESIQLAVEYDPSPPFNGGSARTARESVRAAVSLASAPSLARRRAIVERIARQGV